MATDAIGSSGNLLFSHDISQILIHDNYIHAYIIKYVFVLHNTKFFSEKKNWLR